MIKIVIDKTPTLFHVSDVAGEMRSVVELRHIPLLVFVQDASEQKQRLVVCILVKSLDSVMCWKIRIARKNCYQLAT